MQVIVTDGDLLDQPVEAIVNAWNRNIIPWWLLLPQGVSGAIKRRAGLEPFRELGPGTHAVGGGPIPLGGAVHTSAGRLPYKAIIHVAGIDMLWRASRSHRRRSRRARQDREGNPAPEWRAPGMNPAKRRSAGRQSRDCDRRPA